MCRAKRNSWHGRLAGSLKAATQSNGCKGFQAACGLIVKHFFFADSHFAFDADIQRGGAESGNGGKIGGITARLMLRFLRLGSGQGSLKTVGGGIGQVVLRRQPHFGGSGGQLSIVGQQAAGGQGEAAAVVRISVADGVKTAAERSQLGFQAAFKPQAAHFFDVGSQRVGCRVAAQTGHAEHGKLYGGVVHNRPGAKTAIV